MVTTYLCKLRRIRRDAWMVMVLWAMWSFIYTGALGTLMNLYLLRLGYGPQFIGLFSGLGWIGFSLMGPVAGAAGMRWGARRVMIAGTVLVGVGFGLITLGHGLAEPWRAAWLLTTYVLGFAGGTLIAVNGDPFMMSVCSTVERDHAFGVRQAMTPLASFLGSTLSGFLPGRMAPLLGVTLDSAAPYRYALLVAVSLQVVAVGAAFATREAQGMQRPGTAAAHRGRFPWGPILLVAIFLIFWRVGSYAPGSFLNVYLDTRLRVSTEMIAIIRGVGQLVGIPAGLLMPLLVARWGKARAISRLTAGMGLALVPLALGWGSAAIPAWIVVGVSSVLFSAFSGLSFGVLAIYRQELVAPEWRPAMSGATIMVSGLAGGGSLIGAGYAITALGYRDLFLACAGVSILGALWLWAFSRVPHGEKVHAAAAAQ